MQNEKGFDLAGKKLMIGLPAYDHKVGLKMAISLMRLAQNVVEHGITVQISSICGCSVVTRARNMIAHEFLKSDCDSLIFIDSDMTFDPESVLRLMAWNQNKPIVAGAYEARKDGKIYIQREVFVKLAELHPEWLHQDNMDPKEKLYSFFDFKCTPEGYLGEDFLFCDRAREAGFTVWIDPTIKLGHRGIHEFKSDFGNDIIYPMLKPVEPTMSVAA